MRTYLIFRDLPMHVEYRIDDMPLIPEGTSMHFKVGLKYPRNPKKIRTVDGVYEVVKRRLIYSQKSDSQGMTQYLELDTIDNK